MDNSVEDSPEEDRFALEDCSRNVTDLQTLHLDVQELNQDSIGGIVAKYWPDNLCEHNGLPIYVVLSIDLCRFDIPSKEHAAAWDIDLSKKIIVFIEFNRAYTRSQSGAKVHDVCQSSCCELSNKKVCSKTNFGLSWVLKLRLHHLFFQPGAKYWPNKLLRTNLKNCSHDLAIREIMELTGHSREMVLLALKDGKGDTDDAVNLLFSESYISSHQKKSQRTGGEKNISEKCLSRENFLLQIVHGCEQILKEINSRCLVCAEQLPFEGPVPVICDKQSCIFSYQEFSIGIDLELRLRNNPQVMDLLISILYAAVTNGRVELMFPKHVSDGQRRFYGEDGSLDRTLLKEVLDKLPSIDEMLEMAIHQELKSGLDSLDLLLYPLLRWIVTSNRSYIRLLNPNEQIKEIECDAQFVLLTGPVERENAFQSLKRGNGSFMAFHGSQAGNWHSILALGLKNMSNTSYMSAGAAYGSGIYMADHISTSLGYSQCRRLGCSWSHSMFSQSATFMALCEVINRPAEFTHSGSIIVVPNEKYVTTRYFLVNPKKCTTNARNLQPP